jgi:acetyl-CoA carboxylase biotin carboxyl carrier protein
MPVSIARLRELIELAGSEGVDGVDLVEDGVRIRIVRSGEGPLRRAAEPKAAPQSAVIESTSPDIFPAPMFGVLHLTPSPGAAPYARVGDRVAKGQQLCLIEAMKMFNPVLSDRDGRIEAILADSGAEVANGQPLFRIVAG